jgi:fructose-1,6-bisphosphatase
MRIVFDPLDGNSNIDCGVAVVFLFEFIDW